MSQSQGCPQGKKPLGLPCERWLQLQSGYGTPQAGLCPTSCRGTGEQAGSPLGAGQSSFLSCQEPAHLTAGAAHRRPGWLLGTGELRGCGCRARESSEAVAAGDG